MNLVTWILDNWRLILLAMVIALIVTLYGWGSYHQNRADNLEWKIAEIQRIADEYRKESTQIAKEINDGIPVLVEQAQKTAYANYLKKFGNNAACGVRAISVFPDNGVSETVSPERTDEPSQSEFVAACAIDAGITEKWREWAIANKLEVE